MNPTLRQVQLSDCETLFGWRNTSYIVERSSSQRGVTLEEHKAWFEALIASDDVMAFIIELEGESIGHLRFDPQEDHYIITIYIMPNWGGKGYGVQAIRQGCQLVQANHSTQSILAFIRIDNVLAINAFIRAGFGQSNRSAPTGHLAFEYLFIDEQQDTARQYQNLFKKHGLSYKTLNWGSSESQQLRFKVLCEIGALDSKSILDVGCGLGDLAGWLAHNDINVSYTGLDLTGELIDQARITYPSHEFIHGSVLDSSLFQNRKFDFVVASGIFCSYSLSRDNWMYKAIERMWSLCIRGVGFNSLSSWADSYDQNEFYADPVQTLTFCRKLTNSLVLRHNYHPRDFTIFLNKQSILT